MDAGGVSGSGVQTGTRKLVCNVRHFLVAADLA